VTYNLGLLGLIPMLLMHYGIVKNLRNALRRSKASPGFRDSEERRPSRTLYLLTAGIVALYVNLLINGMLTTVFGGRATFLFMSFLAVLALSEIVNRESLILSPGMNSSSSGPNRVRRERLLHTVYVSSDQRV
jgi:O-antigen ligase